MAGAYTGGVQPSAPDPALARVPPSQLRPPPRSASRAWHPHQSAVHCAQQWRWSLRACCLHPQVKTVPYDPRFPATNQARNCYTRYNEFYKCGVYLDLRHCHLILSMYERRQPELLLPVGC